MATPPLVLLTNDDGLSSNGLLALASALLKWADVRVVAPLEQESRMSRATPAGRSGRVFSLSISYNGTSIPVHGVDGTPAQAVQHAILEILPSPPALVVSGINYGENVGITSTVSGTIGAILEAATWNLRSVAFSLEVSGKDMLSNPQLDFALPAALSARFCMRLIRRPGHGATTFKVDFPSNLSEQTAWMPAFVSRVRKYDILPSGRRELWDHGPLELNHDAWRTKVREFEEGSDAHVLFVQRCIAVSPLTPDPTSYAALDATAAMLASDE